MSASIRTLAFAASLFGATLFAQSISVSMAQSPEGQDPGADLARQAQQKLRQGDRAEAMALYGQALQISPNSFAVNMGAGMAMDLAGEYAQAHNLLAKAIQVAPTPQAKAQAQRTMAMSYGFEGDCRNAAKYEAPLYETYLAAKDFYNAGEMADELARVCIDSGDLDTASTWYEKGHAAGLQEPNIKPDRRDLWDFRWEHAQARIAIRRGNKAEAQKHVAAAKAILDRGTNPQQAQFYPYLTGYVAFYSGDYKTALADLQNANQSDPFIQSLMAQAYEKLGDREHATEYYRKSLGSNAHNPPNAYAHPLAMKKLGNRGAARP